EVKASQRVDRREMAPLRKLRDATGSSFLAGIALHLGAQSYVADDRLHVLPVGALWSPQPDEDNV
ncbi:MAG: ATP-binding protein, partial [Acidimicrobiia bacterium]